MIDSSNFLTLLHHDLRLRRSITRFRRYFTVVNVFRFLWVLVVWTCEAGMFRLMSSRCKWPAQLTHGPVEDSTHILLVADPQVLDLNSYPQRPRWLQILAQYVVDMNLRKSWNAVISKLKPDLVVFLGDMLNNGRSVDDHEFSNYYARFRSIFKLSQPMPVYYISGNHDVGLGPFQSDLIKAHARSRYLQTYGPFNQVFSVANHTFLLIDAPSLVDEVATAVQHEMEWSQMQGGTVEYLKGLYETRPSSEPIILFSHIPLARSNFTAGSCGPLREDSRPILPGSGWGYQNLLPEEVTLYLLHDIRPSIIFSGDDHDYCDYRHVLLDQSEVHEVSVRSFSMAMGIKRPGFQLLSVAPPPLNPQNPLDRSANFAHRPCLLPNQINIYIFQYGLSALLTLALLAVVNYRKVHRRRKPKILRGTSDDEASILLAELSFGGLKRRLGSTAEEAADTQSFEPDRPQSTLLPLYSQNSSSLHSYEPSVKNSRRRIRRWYSQTYWDFLRILSPTLVFYTFISCWYLL